MPSQKSTSDSSIDEYGHEPRETFQNKVLALARSLGEWNDVRLQWIRGGSYNRVVVVHLTGIHESYSGVIRIPRFSVLSDDGKVDNEREVDDGHAVDTEIQDQAVVLQLLQRRGSCAPLLYAFDASVANPLRSPYLVQEYSSGLQLSEIYRDMHRKGKMSIVDEVVNFLFYEEQVTFPQAGRLCVARSPKPPEKGTYFMEFKFARLELEIRGFEIGVGAQPARCVSASLLPDLLSELLEAWYQHEVRNGDDNPVTKMWWRLREILGEMQSLSLFQFQHETGGLGVLYHWDLEPRNILVKKVGYNGSNRHDCHDDIDKWHIDKVIDWDRVLALPPVLTRKPPIWLWDFSDDDGSSILSDYDGDVDLLAPSRYDNIGERLQKKTGTLENTSKEVS